MTIDIKDIVALIDQYALQEGKTVHEVMDTVNRFDQITQLKVTVRTRNALAHSDITSFNELLDCSPHDLMLIPNFGTKALDQLTAALKDFGYIIKLNNGFKYIPIRYHREVLSIYKATIDVNFDRIYNYMTWVDLHGFKYCFGLSSRFGRANVKK